MSKLPKQEPSTGQLSPTTQAVLALVQALLPAMTAILGGLWVVFTYIQHQREAQEQAVAAARKDEIVRSIEVRKPFLSRQLDLYFETAAVTGKIVTIGDHKDSEFSKQVNRYYQLFWTELSLVEDDGVKAAMQNFSEQLQLVQTLEAIPQLTPELTRRIGNENAELRQSAYRLALALKNSLQSTWVAGK